ncbi:MAG: lantibiotic dehydratase family protein [Bacteroidales bacterium]|nr:lantibiotic dehydratase family protein [Bacteroidales bacterium]
MAGKNHNSYAIAETFMLRVPAMPLNILEEISASGQIDELLKKYFSQPIVTEALFLASPGIHRLTNKWLQGNMEDIRSHEKFRHTLIKYLIRMASRSTPFGMFAGIAAGNFSSANNIVLSDIKEHALYVRPDMQYLCSLSEQLQRDRPIRDKLSYFPNSSLYPVGGAYRYIEYLTDAEGVRKYQLQSVSITPELEKVIEAAQNGPGTRALARLIAQGGVDAEEAMAFIQVLIDNQVLVSELEPLVSGTPYLEDLHTQVKQMGVDNQKTRELEEIYQLFDHLQKSAPANRMKSYLRILDVIREKHDSLFGNTLIQADMKLKLNSATLSNNIRNDLENILPVMMKLCRGRSSGLIDKFSEALERRYGSAEIPLAVALDAEMGPGYLPNDQNANASELLKDINVWKSGGNRSEIIWTAVDTMLFGKLQRALIAGETQIEITDADLEQIDDGGQTFPMSFSVLARIYGKWPDNPDKYLIHLSSLGGTSALSLSGRFCHMDQKLLNAMRSIAQIEQEIAGKAVIAEIIHLPQQRTGNILMRPVLRDYEIPYLARPAVGAAQTIKVSDLMVSVRNGKINLRSRKLNAHVIPRMANAHNYALGSLQLYRFLCDFQSQNVSTGLSFSWGPLESECPYLPRIMFRNIILHPATWNLDNKDLRQLKNSKNDRELSRAAEALRLQFHLPDKVVLAVADNELWIDLTHLPTLRLFRNEIKDNSRVVLSEFLFDGKDAVVQGKNGSHANEFVFFFHQKKGLYE